MWYRWRQLTCLIKGHTNEWRGYCERCGKWNKIERDKK